MLGVPYYLSVLGYAGTADCPAFDSRKCEKFDKSLADYHKTCLDLMGLRGGIDGYDVQDLHGMGSLLTLCIGELRRYMLYRCPR